MSAMPPIATKAVSHSETSRSAKRRHLHCSRFPNSIIPSAHHQGLESTMGIIWTIIIGFLAGLIARWIHPGVSNEPSGFVLTTLLGIAGAFVATFLGQAIG